MSSVAANTPSAQRSTPQQQPTPPTSGSATPQPAPAAAAGRSYASAANRKSFGASAHGKSDSSNGARPVAPAVPSLASPTIINGNASVTSPTTHDHVRKPSVTISAAGTSGQMPNGGPVAGQTPTGSQIQFGSITNSPHSSGNTMAQQDTASLSVSAQGNPRVASPSNSPSPVPQPALPSGGRPPTNMHGQSNSVSFGAFSGDNNERRGSTPSQAGTPQMHNVHARRESNHSQQHTDVNMGPGAGRGGFGPGGRGRGAFNQPYSQPPPGSPSNRFTTVPPNGPRVPGPNMGSQHVNQRAAPPYGQGFGSPQIPGRSPHLPHAQPLPHQNPQMPMQSPSMPPAGAYGYPPQGGHNMQAYGTYDPAYYQQQYMQGMQQPMYAPPNSYPLGPGPHSPRPPPYQGQNAGYMQGQYPPQPQPMSRQGSTVSTDRPGSTIGQPPQTPLTPSSGHQHTASRGANSPGPATSQFQRPVKKASAAIKIINPNTGDVVKSDKAPASPAPSTASKAPESAPTPPPRTPSSQHNRTESKVAKSKEEIQKEIREQVQAKLAADNEAATQKAKDEEEAKKRKEQEEEQAARDKADAEEAARKAEEDRKKTEAEAAAKEAEEARLSQERAIEAEKAKAAQQEAAEKKIQDEKARTAAAVATEKPVAPTASSATDEPLAPDMPDPDASDEVWDKYEKDLEEYEKAKEAAYAKKKAAKKEAENRAAAEKLARLDEDLKKQEAEAERLEAEKEKKREAGEADGASSDFAALRKSENAFKATETASESLPEHGSGANTPSGADTPKSDASTMPPPSRPGQKPKPAALKLETQKQVEAAQPSAALQSLRSARRLAHVNPNLYPEGIQSPNPALNTNARGSFRYDKDFLMQFQKVFTEKPSETWTEKLKETVGDPDGPPPSARGNRQSIGAGGRTPSSRGGFPTGGAMGQFGGAMGALRPGTTSEQRFAASGKPPAAQNFIRYDSSKGVGVGVMGGFGAGGSRQPSNVMPRTASSQGGSSRAGGGSRRGRDGPGNKKADASMPLTAGMDLKPIKVSETGWKPQSIAGNNAAGPPPGGDGGYLDPAVVQRKVKSALNKMTPTTFEKISGQILEIVMQSKKESDGRTLRQVIQLTFEKATDEAHWAEMYAQFCGKMLQNMTPEIRDETIAKDKNGQVISGSTLFRKYLLNRCQQDFEQGWKSKLPDKPEDGKGGEAAMLSDEYYIAAAAKRRGLGLVRFIGELFKLSMLTARIMHMCVQRLVDFEGIPDEAEIESLSNLLETIGANLDNLDDKSRGMMNAYFDRINATITLEGLPSRLRFTLMNLVDLRKANWQSKKTQNKGPATIDQVRAEAAAAQREAELKAAAEQQQRRGGGGGRPGVGRGDARNFSGGPPPDFQNNRVNTDDLRRLGKGGSVRNNASGPMGPTSMFNTARGSNKRASMAPGGIFARGAADDSAGSSRTGTPPIKSDKERREEAEKAATTSNAFSALAGLDSNEGNDATSPPASVAALSPPSQKRTLADRSKSQEKANDGASTGA